MSADTFIFRAYTRLKQLQHLLRTGQIDEHFYWTKSNSSAPQQYLSQSRSEGHPVGA